MVSSYQQYGTVSELAFAADLPTKDSYEIHGVRRGLGVTFGQLDIVGEGMGIGGPIGLCNRRAVFPLTAHDTPRENGMLRTFLLNGVSTKKIGHLRVDQAYRVVHGLLAPLYLRANGFRHVYRLLMLTRDAVRVKSRYLETREVGRVHVSYAFSDGDVGVSVKYEGIDGGKLLVANELSGKLFQKLFVDGERIDEIPPLTPINGDHIVLHSPSLKIGMVANRAPGAKLYAGREVLLNRLNWAGLIYMLEGSSMKLNYSLRFIRDD